MLELPILQIQIFFELTLLRINIIENACSHLKYIHE